MQIMTEISVNKQREFSLPFIGEIRPVLIEHVNHGKTGGFTDNYLRVELPEPRPDLANKVVNVRLDSLSAEADKFIGTII